MVLIIKGPTVNVTGRATIVLPYHDACLSHTTYYVRLCTLSSTSDILTSVTKITTRGSQEPVSFTCLYKEPIGPM